ncbi:MAG TPA: sugar phosphate nucleotidyltransferase [Candidatus Limnocylindrales bacterium]|nr:sugar phosphate nucleotidyltransferase [Candidatus Limnocylindrales bacterium]
MYVVIMAGGGGTRLWPLSRPDRPKPFLPLLDDTSLLQRTVARLGEDLGADVTVVTDRRYERLVRDQLPDAGIVLEPAARNTAAAIALATVAIDRPEDEVMVVLPADHVVDHAREGMFHDVLMTAATELATGRRFGIDDPLVTLGVQVAHPSTEYGYLLPRTGEKMRVGRVDAYPLLAFEEKPPAARAEELARDVGVAWNAGMFLWRRRAIRAALERYTALIQLLEPVRHSPSLLEHAYEQLRPVSIDYAVMESAARDGQVVMASMDVGWSDVGSWTALLAAIGAGGTGRVVQPGETVTVAAGDLVVRRTASGEARVVRPLEAGSMTATQPIAVLQGADAARVEALLERCARWEEAR